MPSNLAECEASALKLSASDRAALASRLVESLDSLDEADVERLWVEEAERRHEAYTQGRLSSRPAADVLRDARARLQ